MARLASRNSSNCGNSASVRVAPERLQNRPMSRFLSSSRRTTCTQRSTERRVELRHQRARFGVREEIGRRDHLAAIRLEPRHRLVIAHLALRQRHDRLQVEIDPVGLDGAAQERDDCAPLKAGKDRDRVRCRHCRRGCRIRREDGGRRRRLQGIDRRQRRAGACQRRVVGGDRLGEFLDQAREFLDLGSQRLRRGQRLVEDGAELRLHDVEPPAEFRRAGAPDRRAPRARLATWSLTSVRSCLRPETPL